MVRVVWAQKEKLQRACQKEIRESFLEQLIVCDSFRISIKGLVAAI